MIGWREIPLGEACELYQPPTISTAQLVDDGPYKVYGANGVIGRYHSYNHEEPQLLVTCRGATCGTVNRTGPKVWINGNAMVVRPRSNDVDINYLEHLLRGGVDLSAAITGAAQPQITRQSLAPIRAKFPPLPEQRRIAAILDQADALRAKRREALAQLDELQKAIFIEMFGDPVANPKGWPRTQMQAVCGSPDDIKCGPFGTQLSKSEVTEEGVPLWGIKNVNAAFQLPAFEFLRPTTANRLKAYNLKGGDIVMTRKGTIGNCAVYPDEFPDGVMHSDLLRVRTDSQRCLPVFLSHQLHHSKDVERQLALISGGAVMPGINVTKLKSIEVLVPPIELQQAFVQRSVAIEGIRKRESDALDGMNGLFHSLQHRAFLGEL